MTYCSLQNSSLNCFCSWIIFSSFLFLSCRLASCERYSDNHTFELTYYNLQCSIELDIGNLHVIRDEKVRSRKKDRKEEEKIKKKDKEVKMCGWACVHVWVCACVRAWVRICVCLAIFCSYLFHSIHIFVYIELSQHLTCSDRSIYLSIYLSILLVFKRQS